MTKSEIRGVLVKKRLVKTITVEAPSSVDSGTRFTLTAKYMENARAIADAELFLYQTDARGGSPRFISSVKTDATGVARFSLIAPTVPADVTIYLQVTDAEQKLI